MSDALVLFERDGAIVTLSLNRAVKRNALNLALWGELAAHLDTIEAAGDAIAVVVLLIEEKTCCPYVTWFQRTLCSNHISSVPRLALTSTGIEV